ncbi:ECF-type sigma factor [Bacillus cereus]|uniref:RNA polymerase sigma-70 ECF-like HTH domain-containing protein n=1 Tax=Bacillus cereus TaxID=1396 RepID=A0A9X7QMM8_BACCE|nr:ECF-type sigma factor [Bacillus cereus]QDZ76719.1 hypothetical protein D0437_28225 [Bacillus cereus]
MLGWLKDYHKLEDEIIYLENALDRSKRKLKRWIYGDLQEVSLNAELEGVKLEERIAFRERELTNKMDDMYKLKKLISAFKGLKNKISYLKYVEGMTLEEIAEDLSYSASYIYKKHAEIIRRIKFVEELALY